MMDMLPEKRFILVLNCNHEVDFESLLKNTSPYITSLSNKVD